MVYCPHHKTHLCHSQPSVFFTTRCRKRGRTLSFTTPRQWRKRWKRTGAWSVTAPSLSTQSVRFQSTNFNLLEIMVQVCDHDGSLPSMMLNILTSPTHPPCPFAHLQETMTSVFDTGKPSSAGPSRSTFAASGVSAKAKPFTRRLFRRRRISHSAVQMRSRMCCQRTLPFRYWTHG